MNSPNIEIVTVALAEHYGGKPNGTIDCWGSSARIDDPAGFTDESIANLATYWWGEVLKRDPYVRYEAIQYDIIGDEITLCVPVSPQHPLSSARNN